MPERRVTVVSRVGLHARPASLFAEAAANLGHQVALTSESGQTVNAASILGVLSLGIGCGETVVLSAEGEGAEVALDALEALLNTDLDLA
ncbi:MAG: HPr family phosphocarrier protein [Salinibacterium sp.]|nr:MAG: HPr family phosphocarrier protein [Salinibacterium sp.]